MANANETVREVCAEMHDRDHNSFTDLCLRGFSDRILSAHGREMAAKAAEIARLKAALRPVMDVPVVSTENVTVIKMGNDDNPWFGHDYGGVVDGGYTERFYQTILNAHNAVREAQLIAKEGGSND